ncbi:WD40 repeat-containing protein [Thecamonas trahens ATCC 50062]|uniref:WD40 repeat-containing protein n=1 Tax=Thecamonas trahens ATCC 50062 TaxID=461836 RepID=A0A0L0D916_THETB|nr:WD40 repeat-containing protein [Thecamonas trahens ATCC 50062]KNC48839.1 WD40 repeat-containing protein [Thecamonas trahens ATCC 50062]|eukprot:XP_013758259.1 WD40 repeat-containing protein [Thecamonas trahens ATCC 50062]
MSSGRNVLAQFVSESGESTGPQLDLPEELTSEQLQLLLNELMENDDADTFAFSVSANKPEITPTTPSSALLDDAPAAVDVTGTVGEALDVGGLSRETGITIVYRPLAAFKVRAVSRCAGTMPGHTEAVLDVSFSPDGQTVASASGDNTVRIWNALTVLPVKTLKGHTGWVLRVAWSPDGETLASASMDGTVRLWSPTGDSLGVLKGHKKWVTDLAWHPTTPGLLASSSKDTSIILWDTVLKRIQRRISGCTKTIAQVAWIGDRLVSGAHDKLVRLHSPDDGKLRGTLSGHAHRVTVITVSPDGDHYVTGSDDHTCIMWQLSQKKPVARMVGHQAPISHASFSPDGRYVASCAFDKSVKIWDGKTGAFLFGLRGHVAAVYRVCFSADSRLLATASADATVKVWSLAKRKMIKDLAGHADAIYALDWASTGGLVCSGSKDRLLKIWRS